MIHLLIEVSRQLAHSFPHPNLTQTINCKPSCQTVNRRHWSTSEVHKMRLLNPCHEYNQCQTTTTWATFRSLTCETSLGLQQRVPHRVRSSSSFFNIQWPIVCLTLSSSCLCLLFYLPVTSILSSIFTSVTCFLNWFLRKMWPTDLGFVLCTVLHCTVGKILFYFSTVCNRLLRFTHVRSIRSTPSFAKTTSLNFKYLS
jgi:hypothetical protein